jgi:beta-mannosidase
MPYAAYDENTSRFMSEYGFQSFPTLDSVARYAPQSEWRIDSPVMLSHQRHPRGNQLVRAYMERDFHVPADFGAFLYMSQVLQATVIQYGAEAHRRHMPYNMGTLYWQLDDCWPVASWSGIDYYGRWKALHYAARRFFAPVLVSPVETKGNVQLYVISDQRADRPARLTVRVLDFDGREHWRQDRDITVRALTSEVQSTLPRGDLLKGLDASQAVLVAELRAGGGAGPVLSRNLFFFAKTRELALPKPEVAISVEPHGASATVHVSAKRFARAVWLSTSDGAGAFSDNFFDLLPGETATVEWTPGPEAPAGAAAQLAGRIHAMSVRDTY